MGFLLGFCSNYSHKCTVIELGAREFRGFHDSDWSSGPYRSEAGQGIRGPYPAPLATSEVTSGGSREDVGHPPAGGLSIEVLVYLTQL